MSSPLVGIVIINWNHLDLTKKCLQSIKKQSLRPDLVVIIDNGSTDGSVEWLKAITDDHTIAIFNTHNLGFARAINQGFAYIVNSGCRYAVGLNNDAEANTKWLKSLVHYMEKHPECGFAQGASMQAGQRDRFDSSGIYLERGFIPNQRALGATDPRLDVPVIGPNAAGAIYRTSMLKVIAHHPGEYFDNRFFAYVEDVDFNLRCTLRGYKFAFVPAAIMYHLGSKTGNRIARKKMFWGARNLVWLVYKNVPLGLLRRTLRLIIKSHVANIQFLWREQRQNFVPYVCGICVGLLGIPLFAFKRHANLGAMQLSITEAYELLVPSDPPVHNPFKKIRSLINHGK